MKLCKSLLTGMQVFTLCAGMAFFRVSQAVSAEAGGSQNGVSERTEQFSPVFKNTSERELIDYAERFFAQEDYYNALTFYRLALFKSSSKATQERLRFQIALCYQLGKRWEEAENAFDEFIAHHPDSPRLPEASYRIGQGFFRAQDFTRAINHFRDTRTLFPESEYAIRSQYAIGLSYARLGKWQLTQEELRDLMEHHADHELGKQAQKLQLLAQEGETLPKKSPLLAGVLSVVPGLGKLYTTHYGGAIIAFVVNAGLGFVIYDSFDHDRYAVGAIFSTLAAATYSANIIGGYRSAKRYNALHEDQFAEKIAQEAYVPELELYE